MFGVTLSPEVSEVETTLPAPMILQVATLGPDAEPDKRHVVQVTTLQGTFTICSLREKLAEQIKLGIEFPQGERLQFKLIGGNTSVSLLMNILEPEDDEEDDDDEDGYGMFPFGEMEGEDDEDEDDEDEEDDGEEEDEDEDDSIMPAEEVDEEEEKKILELKEQKKKQQNQNQTQKQGKPQNQPAKKQEAPQPKKQEPVKPQKDQQQKPGGWTQGPKGLKYQIKTPSSNPTIAKPGDKVNVKYIGKLQNGKVFDKGTIDFKLGAGEVIQGWDLGVSGMAVGEERDLSIPSHLAYGHRGAPPDIPPNATLNFNVKLLRTSSNQNSNKKRKM